MRTTPTAVDVLLFMGFVALLFLLVLGGFGCATDRQAGKWTVRQWGFVCVCTCDDVAVAAHSNTVTATVDAEARAERVDVEGDD